MLNGFFKPVGQIAVDLDQSGPRCMDSYSEHSSEYDPASAQSVAAGDDVASAIGTDERRMHVRAYNYWVSLLDGREFPSIEDLDPQAIEPISRRHSVIVDLTGKLNMPATPFVGDAIRTRCGVEVVNSISDVPGRSLLSRLTDHYFQIVANRAPIGFEAEFVNQRGVRALLSRHIDAVQQRRRNHRLCLWRDQLEGEGRRGPASGAACRLASAARRRERG